MMHSLQQDPHPLRRKIEQREARVAILGMGFVGLPLALEFVRRAGVDAIFYDLRKDGSVDIEDLRSRCDGRTRAIFLIHYFGFPQPMEPIQRPFAVHIHVPTLWTHLLLDTHQWFLTLGDREIESAGQGLGLGGGHSESFGEGNLSPTGNSCRSH